VPRQPLVLPPNFRDVTAEKIGTGIGIIGASATGAYPQDRVHEPSSARGGVLYRQHEQATGCHPHRTFYP
jgi:hypothetical protein